VVAQLKGQPSRIGVGICGGTVVAANATLCSMRAKIITAAASCRPTRQPMQPPIIVNLPQPLCRASSGATAQEPSRASVLSGRLVKMTGTPAPSTTDERCVSVITPRTLPPTAQAHSPRDDRGSPFSSLLGKICSSAKQFATYKGRGLLPAPAQIPACATNAPGSYWRKEAGDEPDELLPVEACGLAVPPELTAPCGAPDTPRVLSPSSTMPTLSHFAIRRRMRLSAIRCSDSRQLGAPPKSAESGHLLQIVGRRESLDVRTAPKTTVGRQSVVIRDGP
jgi:hypothetical protein